MRQNLHHRGVLVLLLVAAAFLLPAEASPQGNGAVTKGAFIDRFFVNPFTRSPRARDYAPANIASLPPAGRYEAVVKGLSEKGVVLLVNSKPEEPLTRLEYLTLTYLLAGGPPGKSLGGQKDFLKEKGVLDRNDIGVIKTFQGDITVTRTGQDQAQKITGAEPVLFRDVDETTVGAKMELLFDDGSTLSIGEDTAITIDEMVFDPKSGRRSIQLRLTVGTIKVAAAPNTHPRSRFDVLTPSLVAGVRGTVFGVSVDPQGRSRVVGFEGRVGVRPLTPEERRPPGAAERRAAERRGVTAPPPTAPAQPGAAPAAPAQEVIVGVGQTAELNVGATAPAAVRQSTQQETQQVEQATAVTAPAQTAAVTTTQVQQANVVVTTEVKQSTVETVASKQEATQVTATNIVTQDKGKATEDTVQEGSGTIASGSTSLPTSSIVSLSGLTGTQLKSAFLQLTGARQAEEFGALTASQQASLAGQLSLAEAAAVLARFTPGSGGSFTSAVLKSLLDFGVAFENITETVTDSKSRSGTSNRVGSLLGSLTPAQAVQFANCERNFPTRRCVGSTTSAGNFDWFRDFPDDDELTTHGAAVATALSRRLDFLAAAGGTLPVPGTSILRQMILATAAPDDVIPGFGVDFQAFFNGQDPWFASAVLLFYLDDLHEPALVTDQQVKDVWGGEMRPSVYTINGGFQAGQLRSTAFGARGGSNALIDVSSRVGALNADGFLSYAVQVEEDVVNAVARIVHDRSGGASPTFVGGSLPSLVDSQLVSSDIRARDAFWQAQADARAGLVFFNSEGRRVRAQQYVYRPALNPDEVRMTSVTLADRRSLSYLDLRATFNTNELSGKTALQIRDLPWNSYFSVFYTGNVATCAASGCSVVIGSPGGSPTLAFLRVEIGNEIPGEFLREALTLSARATGQSVFNYDGTASSPVDHQFVSQMQLTVQKSGQSAQVFTNHISSGFDPRAGANNAGNLANATPAMSSVPVGGYRVRPARYFSVEGIAAQGPTTPPGFNYFAKDSSGNILQFGVRYGVLGDATTTANSGLQTAGTAWCTTTPCTFAQINAAPIRFDTIWDTFRVNLSDSTANPQGLPTINIGANILSLRLPATLDIPGQSPFTQDIRAAFIPFPRMIWRGETGF